jgi:CubicO group peptidase (beta-lactamase class C family)
MADTRPLIVCSVANGVVRCEQPAVLVPWWSIAKTAVAACVLVLVAGGRLDLDAPLRGRAFTLRQLLQHTSGLPDYAESDEYEAAVDRHEDPWSEQGLLAHIEAAQMKFEPGRSWSYSNSGYVLVRKLIEQTTGLGIEQALKALVLGPLGISDSFVARTRAHLARSVYGDEDDFHPGWVGHGLLLGPPSDVARFMHGLFTDALLPEPLRAEMRRRHAIEVELADRPWRTKGYGLGLMMDIASPHGLCIGHSGQGPDSVSAAYHFPDLYPPVTVAAFAPTDDQGIAERAVLDAAARLR